MTKERLTEFTVVDDDNADKIVKELKAGKGIILIARPEYYSGPKDMLTGECELHLFDRPSIDTKRGLQWLTTERGRGSVQTGWENDRAYLLRQKPEPTDDPVWNSAREMFKYLPIGEKYRFEIGFQSCAAMSLSYKGDKVIYIPRSVPLQTAFMYGLGWMTDMLNLQEDWRKRTGFRFTERHIEEMVAYALNDLGSGEVLKHNVQAGRDADALVGLG